MDIKQDKLNKKINLTHQIAKTLTDIDQVDFIKDNTLLVKTQIRGNIVYYKIVVSEIIKNVDDWIDLVEEYKMKKGEKNDKR